MLPFLPLMSADYFPSLSLCVSSYCYIIVCLTRSTPHMRFSPLPLLVCLYLLDYLVCLLILSSAVPLLCYPSLLA